MADIKVAVINATSEGVLSDVDAEAAVRALQQQVTADFAPVWGSDADLTFVARDQRPPAGMWWLALLDTSDEANAAGYHDLSPEGLPLGKVFVKTEQAVHSQWTVAASHELLEMLGDPDINLWAFPHPEAGRDRLYGYEVCDACEADEYGYLVNGILVSDFLYPAWFESFRRPGSTQFDKQGQIQQPFQILPGGYSLVYDVRSGSGYHQIFGGDEGQSLTANARPRVGSRRERRMTSREHWLRSAANGCGQERWPVKTLTDADANRVAIAAPVATTVAALRALPRPIGTDQIGPQGNRLAPVELTVYRVTAALVGAKIESDSDVHLVIADLDDPSARMIAEFPDPHCVDDRIFDPKLKQRMTAARNAVLALAGPRLRQVAAGGVLPMELIDPATQKPRLLPLAGRAQITGVGFFDVAHGQAGMAPNVIELHPVLDFAPMR